MNKLKFYSQEILWKLCYFILALIFTNIILTWYSSEILYILLKNHFIENWNNISNTFINADLTKISIQQYSVWYIFNSLIYWSFFLNLPVMYYNIYIMQNYIYYQKILKKKRFFFFQYFLHHFFVFIFIIVCCNLEILTNDFNNINQINQVYTLDNIYDFCNNLITLYISLLIIIYVVNKQNIPKLFVYFLTILLLIKQNHLYNDLMFIIYLLTFLEIIQFYKIIKIKLNGKNGIRTHV